MSFDVPAESYDRFMGRFSGPLAGGFADLAGLRAGQRALDVGCGPGALTAVLVDRLGAAAVSAVDPSEPFLAAARSRCPGVDVRRATAEQLPFPDGSFDAVLAQLVVHFMTDPVAGLREMGRVARPGGVVGACVWDHGGGTGPLSTFWQAARDLHARAPGEEQLPGSRAGELATLAAEAGLADVTPARLTVRVGFPGFAAWWEPFRYGVGPAGSYVSGLDEEQREALRRRCAELLPAGPFELEVAAWAVTARTG
jgi:SAM-dependent methyltransferase